MGFEKSLKLTNFNTSIKEFTQELIAEIANEEIFIYYEKLHAGKESEDRA